MKGQTISTEGKKPGKALIIANKEALMLSWLFKTADRAIETGNTALFENAVMQLF